MRRFLWLLILLLPLAGFGQVGPRPTSAKWDLIQDPGGNLALDMGTYTTVFTWVGNTGAGDMFTFRDTAGNTGTGSLLNLSVSTDALKGNMRPLYTKIGRNGAQGVANIRNQNATGAVTLDLITYDVGGAGVPGLAFAGGYFKIFRSISSFTAENTSFWIRNTGQEMGFTFSNNGLSTAEKGLTVNDYLTVESNQSNTATKANWAFVRVAHANNTKRVYDLSQNGPATIGGYSFYLDNDPGTGTLFAGPAKLSGGKLIRTAAGDSSGAVGIVIMGAGTSGVAKVVVAGLGHCAFDGATTGDHYVQISAGSPGQCTDAGAGVPAAGQILGRVLETSGVSGTFPMVVNIQER